MNRIIFVSLFVILSLPVIALASSTTGGGSSSHGGDLERDQSNVWFVGDQIVKYCVKNSGFSLSIEETNKLVIDALKAWSAFFRKYQLDTLSFTGFPDGVDRKLSLLFEPIPRCDHPESQIEFAFGEQPELVQRHRPDADSSLGVAVRYPYDHNSYRSGGTIWIRNHLPSINAYRHILLHELGHAFGMPHNSVWVMDDTVAHRVTDLNENKDPAIGKIESPAWKFLPQENEELDLTYRYRQNNRSKPFGAPNFLLNGGIAQLFQIGNDYFKTHRLVMKYFLSFEAGRELPIGRRIVELQMTKDSLTKQIWRGEFGVGTKKDIGPGIWTRWKAADGTLNHGIRRLVKTVIPFPTDGSFETEDGTIIPAIIQNYRGPELRIFSAEDRTWWSSNKYELSRKRDQVQ